MSFLNGTIVDPLDDSVAYLLHHQAYIGPVLFLMLEEMGVPFGIPGDFVIMYTGYQVSKGAISYPVALVLLLTAVLIGSSVLYFLSSRYGRIIVLRLGGYLHINEEKIGIVEKYFKRFGPLVIIFGRHIPGFRVPITIFAGISKISYTTFILSTFVSVIFWIAIYLSIGERLGKRTVSLISEHHGFVIAILIFIIVIAILVYIAQRQGKRKDKKHALDVKK